MDAEVGSQEDTASFRCPVAEADVERELQRGNTVELQGFLENLRRFVFSRKLLYEGQLQELVARGILERDGEADQFIPRKAASALEDFTALALK